MTADQFQLSALLGLSALAAICHADQRRLRRVLDVENVRMTRTGHGRGARWWVHRASLEAQMPEVYRGIVERLETLRGT
jgi:hypothetical protein